MLIMGIDPGTAITGYGIIEVRPSSMKAVDFGCVRTGADELFEERLAKIYKELTAIISGRGLDAVAVEQIFFNKNSRTALAVGQARGAVLLAAVHQGVSVVEYTPLQLKQALVGYGKAEKGQVQEMVRILLSLKEIPRPNDAADALGIAICHAQTHNFNFAARKKGE